MSLTASPSTVLSEGYGTWGSIYLLPTLGYGIPAQAITATTFWRPYAAETSDQLMASVEVADQLVYACETQDILINAIDDQVQ